MVRRLHLILFMIGLLSLAIPAQAQKYGLISGHDSLASGSSQEPAYFGGSASSCSYPVGTATFTLQRIRYGDDQNAKYDTLWSFTGFTLGLEVTNVQLQPGLENDDSIYHERATFMAASTLPLPFSGVHLYSEIVSLECWWQSDATLGRDQIMSLSELSVTDIIVQSDINNTWFILAQALSLGFILAQIALIIVALIHIRRQPLSVSDQLFWDVVILFVPIFGVLMAFAKFPPHFGKR